jgi:replicative DNA helicase
MLLAHHNTLQSVYTNLKAEFPDPGVIPGLGVMGVGILKCLYESGLCDMAALDMRTGGSYHDIGNLLVDSVTNDGALDGPAHTSGLSVAEGSAGYAVNATEDPRVKAAEALLKELGRERDKQRILISLEKSINDLSTGKVSPEKAKEYISEELARVCPPPSIAQSFTSMLTSATASLTTLRKSGARLKTGLLSLDGKFMLRPANLLTVGAPTSHGKTAALVSLLTVPALKGGMRVLYNCFEDYHIFPHKLASSMFGVPLQYLTMPEGTTTEQFEQATDALSLCSEYDEQLLILPGVEMSEFEAECKRFSPDLIIMDYLQKYVEAYGSDEKRESCGKITSRFQDIARKRNIFSVMSSQIRRRELARMDKSSGSGVLRRPSLSDLKESGDIENYTDACWILWWPWRDLNTEQATSVDMHKYFIQIAKDKLGAGGDVECRFYGETLTYKDKYQVA